jgi:nucleotide-binding universal stress UspA family protein
MSFRSILCPVDLSATSRAAARTAAVMASRFTAKLSVVFVDDPLLSQAAARFDEDEIGRRTEAELTTFVQKAIGPRTPCTYEMVNGDPAEEILTAARRLGADLIVMGTQGHRGPKRLFFGSTADAVLRRSTIPVLVVPPTRRT